MSTDNHRPHAGKRNNTNARKHGWYSRSRPTPLEEIITAGHTAIDARDFKTLARVVRVLKERGYAAQARKLDDVIRRMRLRDELQARTNDVQSWSIIEVDPNPDGTDPA